MKKIIEAFNAEFTKLFQELEGIKQQLSDLQVEKGESS